MITSTKDKIKGFLSKESSGGIILIFAALLAMIIANLAFTKEIYNYLLDLHIGVNIGNLHLNKPLLLWINDGLMSLFFLIISIEIKHEIINGHLSTMKKASFPLITAVGGMLAPALIFTAFNYNTPYSHGWAIPMATDIAFAVGVLSLLGKKVPTSMKVFLLALAVIDDFGAIAVIAIFYTSNLNITLLVIATIVIIIMIIFNRLSIRSVTPYIVLYIILWILLLKSGVHATIAGVVTGFLIPYRNINGYNPAKALEYEFKFFVNYIILPLFAFVNSGITLSGLNIDSNHFTLILGIFCGLVIGKSFGILIIGYIGDKLGIANKPKDITWFGIFSVGILCAIGFTMSMFLTNLSYDVENYTIVSRVTILVTSLMAAIIGFISLKIELRPKPVNEEDFSGWCSYPREIPEKHKDKY